MDSINVLFLYVQKEETGLDIAKLLGGLKLFYYFFDDLFLDITKRSKY